MSEAEVPASSYTDALQELREIQSQLEADDVDIDSLGALVERSALLIKFCRETLDKTESKVREVVASLDEPQS